MPERSYDWREDGSDEQGENYFQVNLDDVFTNYETDFYDDINLESIDYEDFSESSDSEL